MATLQQAIDQIQDIIGAMSDIRAAPDEPPERMNRYPFAVCYAGDGVYALAPPDTMTGLHNIILELHVARKNLPRDVSTAMGFAKSIPNAIFKGWTDGNISAIQTFEQISYAFGVLETWPDIPTVGFRFTIENVKTQDEVT